MHKMVNGFAGAGVGEGIEYPVSSWARANPVYTAESAKGSGHQVG